MNETLLYILGILIMILGLAISIGLHEFGHLIPAKIFAVKVPNWAIGFGPKLFSKKIGETEYSVRLVPLGGFITMIGMYPPANPEKPDSKRWFGNIIAQSRAAHSEHMVAGDESRTLYSKPAWQRIIIMFGGPFVNLFLGLLLITISLSGIGTYVQSSTVESVVQCQEQMTNSVDSCTSDSLPTPAYAAGLKAGDVIKSIDGQQVSNATQALATITKLPLVAHSLLIQRGESSFNVKLKAVEGLLPTADAKGNVTNQKRAYIGIRLNYVRQGLPITDSLALGFGSVGKTFSFIGQFPIQVYETAVSLFNGQHRGTDSAVSVVGVSQVAGQVTASKTDWLDKVFSNLMLIGSLNLALFTFNMIPVPPLDGGHIAGGIYEYLKRGFARVFRRKDPGPIDTALMAPIAQAMFLLLFLAGAVVIVADFLNPIVT